MPTDDLVHPEVMLEPPSGPGEVLVTGIHWLDAACVGFESSLIASYMHHGITYVPDIYPTSAFMENIAGFSTRALGVPSIGSVRTAV